MNHLPAILVVCLFLIIAAAGQTRSTSVCTGDDGLPDGVILNICTFETGMAPRPQPRLRLRLFADGRAEYEHTPAGSRWEDNLLVKKQVRVTAKQVDEIIGFGLDREFQNASGSYPAFRLGDDSTLTTTVIFRGAGGAEKKIVVTNYAADQWDNYKYYPAPFNYLMDRAEGIWKQAMGYQTPIPTVNFCYLSKHREQYTGRRYGVYAEIDYTRFMPFISDPACTDDVVDPFRPKDRMSIGYGVEGKEMADLRARLESIRIRPFFGRASVIIYGTLSVEKRNASLVETYRFDITEIKTMNPITDAYKGKLEPGRLYMHTFENTAHGRRRGACQADGDIPIDTTADPGCILPPVIAPGHHAARVEWTNLDKFPALRHKGLVGITFLVVSRNVVKIDKSRWNDTYVCEIIKVEK